jgi:hypothetical protein
MGHGHAGEHEHAALGMGMQILNKQAKRSKNDLSKRKSLQFRI